jgi:hypothetical protein
MRVSGKRQLPIRRLIPLCALFLVVISPWLVFVTKSTGQAEVNEQAFYSFYASEGWVQHLGGDTEDSGYQVAVSTYGSPDENHDSILRAIARNPIAFGQRLTLNLQSYQTTLSNPDFLPGAVLALALVGCVRAARSSRSLLLLLLLVGGVNLVYLAFQVDPRYVTHVVPVFAVLAGAGLAWPMTLRLPQGAPPFLIRGLALTVVLIAAVWVARDSLMIAADQWKEASPTTEEPEKQLADELRALPGMRDGMILRAVGGPLFPPLIAYYSRARFSWGVPDGPSDYPRSRVFSMISYPTVEALAIDSALLFGVELPDDVRPAGSFDDPDLGIHYLILAGHDANVAGRPVQPVVLQLANEYTDRVGCAPGALTPDGKADLLLQLVLHFPRWPPSDEVDDVVLQRVSGPAGVWSTGNLNYPVGIAASPNGPLLNSPTGTVEFEVQGGVDQTYFLFSCADLANINAYTYRALVHVRNGPQLTSPVVGGEI